MINVIIADYKNPQHQQAILELLNEYANDPMGGGQPISSFVEQHLIENLKEMPGAFSVLAFDQKKPIGLVNVFQGFSTFKCQPLLNIHDLAVSKEYRNRGIAKKLLAQVQAVATARKCCKITLEVLTGNHAAKTAYGNFGFKNYELDPQAGHAIFLEKRIV